MFRYIVPKNTAIGSCQPFRQGIGWRSIVLSLDQATNNLSDLEGSVVPHAEADSWRGTKILAKWSKTKGKDSKRCTKSCTKSCIETKRLKDTRKDRLQTIYTSKRFMSVHVVHKGPSDRCPDRCPCKSDFVTTGESIPVCKSGLSANQEPEFNLRYLCTLTSNRPVGESTAKLSKDAASAFHCRSSNKTHNKSGRGPNKPRQGLSSRKKIRYYLAYEFWKRIFCNLLALLTLWTCQTFCFLAAPPNPRPCKGHREKKLHQAVGLRHITNLTKQASGLRLISRVTKHETRWTQLDAKSTTRNSFM